MPPTWTWPRVRQTAVAGSWCRQSWGPDWGCGYGCIWRSGLSLAKSVGLCLGGVWGGGLQMQMQMLFVVHFRWLSAALFLLDAWWFVVAARIGCVRDVRLRRAALSLVNNWNWNSSKLLCGCGSRWMKVFSLPRSIYQGDRDIVVLYSIWTI